MLPGDHVMKMIYNELADLADLGHVHFSQKVKLVLSFYGFDINQLIGATHREIKKFELIFREILFARYIQKWFQNLHLFPKLVAYREIKTDYKIAPYILYIPDKRHQQAVARLRVSSHNLNIVIGRHSRLVELLRQPSLQIIIELFPLAWWHFGSIEMT